jgi:hypothetical protein
VYDFGRRVASDEKFPSFTLGFKPFDAAVLEHDASAPECVKLASS